MTPAPQPPRVLRGAGSRICVRVCLRIWLRICLRIGLRIGLPSCLWLLHAAAAAVPYTLNFEQLSVRDGLAQETVTAIVQDRTGYMWFGSQHGLSRYDGYRVTVYRTQPGDPRSLADNWVQVLHVDAHNRLWVGTRGGLQRFDPDTGDFTRFDPPVAAGGRTVRHQVQAIVDDRAGHLWLGTSAGLRLFDPATGHDLAAWHHDPRDPASLASNQVNALVLDAGGALWVGMKHGLDRRVPGATRFEHFRIDPPDRPNAALNEVQGLHVDADAALWLVTMDGLVSWRPGRPGQAGMISHLFGPADGLAPGLVTALMRDRDGTLWIGTNTNGLQRWDAARRRFVAIPADPHQVASNEVSSLFQDHGGTLWVGTWTAGVRRVDLASGGFSRYFHIPGDAHSLHDNRVYGICGDGRGGLLLAGLGGIDRLDPADGQVTRLPMDAGFARHMHNKELVLAVYRDARGVTWAGSSAELGRFDPASARYTSHRFASADPNSNSITHIAGDRAGNLWAASRGGLHRIDGAGGPDRSFRHDALDPASLSDDWVRMTVEDADGALWVATDNGLNLLAPGRDGFRHFHHDPADPASISSDRVQALFLDRRGTLWVGTNGGLNRVERDAAGRVRFRRYTTRDGLADDAIGAILEADDGQLWLSTAVGISRMDPRGAGGRGAFRNYSARDGMIEGFYFSASAYRDRDGTMYFGGVNGLTVFQPAHIRDNPYAAPAVVTAVQAGGRALAPGRAGITVLPHDAAALAFEFAALHYGDPARNRFRYRLRGYDRDWIPSDAARRQATYTNLDPGRYVFQVQAANKDGVWGAPSAPLVFDITPPLWQRWWFRLAAALACLALVWAGDRARTGMHARRRRALEAQVQARTAEVQRQKEALEAARAQLQRYVEDRERLFISISHDLRTPITRLKLRSELLDDDAVREEFHEDLDDLDMMVKGALQTVKDSAIHENTTAVRLDVLIGRMLRGAALAGHRIDFEPAGIVVAARPLALRRAIGNLLDNALFYGGTAAVATVRDGDAVHIRIRDRGPGVPADQLARLLEPHVRLDHGRARNPNGLGLGLSIARGIVEAHGGTLRLENHAQGGLLATIILPGETVS